ncbi:restriction endonuclease [Acinetobacter sp.]|uniref:restriction endonuclease n=1 Tax=Acinetobacter sp. TaxID=472 RepID=UPI0026483278|nr:restriction endonuclease [Acinetobacter sp.]MDN5526082.1 restriction endonuclease [Acinetobacter sp.]
MSSKGKEYEIAAYQYFDNLIKQRFFGYPPEQCYLKHQSPYFSKDREKNIYFDLSLEYFLPDQSTPFLIHIIECKNYNKKVCIDDVEEFASKLEQLRTFKVFPIFLTTVGFQEGCLTFAKNRGIAFMAI